MLVVIIIIIAVVVFIHYCSSVGEAMEDYQNRPDEWNPTLPPNIPPIPQKLPPAVQCRCIDCKYFYQGSKTEYFFDENALKGRSEITRYNGLCLRTKFSVDKGELQTPYSTIRCSLFETAKNNRK